MNGQPSLYKQSNNNVTLNGRALEYGHFENRQAPQYTQSNDNMTLNRQAPQYAQLNDNVTLIGRAPEYMQN